MNSSRLPSEVIAGTGTINPAALSSAGPINPPPPLTPEPSPRGLKRSRSRSPELYGDAVLATPFPADDSEARSRKKAKPTSRIVPPPTPATIPQVPQYASFQGPTAPIPGYSVGIASQTSAQNKDKPKSTLKALPTVRDHTTDQLTADGDEYVTKETDAEGEKKISPNGELTGGRHYRCRTFLVPGRGQKLFMMATECARVLNYRDSYLLFNKNKSLFKIIASQAEKEDLINKDILPYSYRSRQIAIVSAKSMFRQFGSKVIVEGMRVKDDYWVAKARKQGFTEADPAFEKRPGISKRSQEEQGQGQYAAMSRRPQDVVLADSLGITTGGMTHYPPNFTQPTEYYAEFRPSDLSAIPRARHELTGQPYQDHTRPSLESDIQSQAQHAADFNKTLNQGSAHRGNVLRDHYNQVRLPPATPPTASMPLHSVDNGYPTAQYAAVPRSVNPPGTFLPATLAGAMRPGYVGEGAGPRNPMPPTYDQSPRRPHPSATSPPQNAITPEVSAGGRGAGMMPRQASLNASGPQNLYGQVTQQSPYMPQVVQSPGLVGGQQPQFSPSFPSNRSVGASQSPFPLQHPQSRTPQQIRTPTYSTTFNNPPAPAYVGPLGGAGGYPGAAASMYTPLAAAAPQRTQMGGAMGGGAPVGTGGVRVLPGPQAGMGGVPTSGMQNYWTSGGT